MRENDTDEIELEVTSSLPANIFGACSDCIDSRCVKNCQPLTFNADAIVASFVVALAGIGADESGLWVLRKAAAGISPEIENSITRKWLEMNPDHPMHDEILDYTLVEFSQAD